MLLVGSDREAWNNGQCCLEVNGGAARATWGPPKEGREREVV